MTNARTQLIAAIEQDIRHRGLCPGDRYLSTREVARMHHVSTKTANEALRELAEQDVLVRKQRSGTLVGPKAGEGASPKCVHLLMRGDVTIYAKPFINEFLAGMQHAFPDEAIQVTFIPAGEELRFVRALVDTATSGGILDGVVLFLSSPVVQRFFAESQVPAVVAGSVYPDVAGLAWVDIDQREIGRLLAQYVVAHGHERVTVLMREQWAYDDNLLVDGVQEALDASGLGHNALSLRTVHAEGEVVKDTVRGILSGPEPPTAFICRSARLLRSAAAAVEELGLRVPEDVLLTVADCLLTKEGAPAAGETHFPYMATSVDGEEHGALAGQMLRQVIETGHADPDHHVIPVELVDPFVK
ncbi:MAG: substrate-binding domain-containing protein [bacterium]|nr:substrate-binding domain-containing protein [bacterium]